MSTKTGNKFRGKGFGREGTGAFFGIDAADEVIVTGDFLAAGGTDGIDDALNGSEFFRGHRGKAGLDFHIDGKLGSVFPKDVAVKAIDVLPRLGGKGVMDDAVVGAVDVPVADGFHVPAAGEPVDFVFADDIEIVLVLSDNKVVITNKGKKLAEDVVFPPLSGVDDDHAGVEVFVAVDAENFFRVIAAIADIVHDGFGNGGHIGVAHRCVIEFGDVIANASIRVDIDGFVILGEVACDNEAEIGGGGVIVADWERGDDAVDQIRDVIEFDGRVGLGHRKDHFLGFVVDVRVQDVDFVFSAGGHVVK